MYIYIYMYMYIYTYLYIFISIYMYRAQTDTHRHRHACKHKHKPKHWHRHRRRRKHRHITCMHEPIKQTEQEHPTEKRCSGHQGFTAVWNSVRLIITHSECWLHHNESCWPCEHTCHAGWWRSRAPMSRKIVFFPMIPPNKALLHPHRARVCGCDCMCAKVCVNTCADFGNLAESRVQRTAARQKTSSDDDGRYNASSDRDGLVLRRSRAILTWWQVLRGHAHQNKVALALFVATYHLQWVFRCDLPPAMSVRGYLISLQVLENREIKTGGADRWVLI